MLKWLFLMFLDDYFGGMVPEQDNDKTTSRHPLYCIVLSVIKLFINEYGFIHPEENHTPWGRRPKGVCFSEGCKKPYSLMNNLITDNIIYAILYTVWHHQNVITMATNIFAALPWLYEKYYPSVKNYKVVWLFILWHFIQSRNCIYYRYMIMIQTDGQDIWFCTGRSRCVQWPYF